MKQTGLLPTEEIEPEDPEYNYEIQYKIKSPLSVLKYNLTYLFEDNYPAKMNPDFARDMILMYSKKGDLIFDGCSGSGTVPLMAAKNNRVGYGIDANPKAVALAREHAQELELDSKVEAFFEVGDSRNYVPKIAPSLILSSLPFGLNIGGDKNHYSDEVNDISNCETYEKFFEEAEKIIKNYYKILKSGGICILDARDRTKDGKLYDLINEFRNMAKRAGFEILARYYFELPPYRQLTFRHKQTRYVMPMIDAMDVLVLFKPENAKIENFSA